MSWFVYALLAAVLVSFSSVVEKKILFTEHAMEFASVNALLTALLVLPLGFFVNFGAVPIKSLVILFITSLIGSIAYVLVARAMRHIEVSVVSSLMVLAPALTSVLATLFLGEKLNASQSLGILMLLLGAYVLQTKPEHSLLEPWQIIKNSRYLHFVFIAILIYASTALGDRLILGYHHLSPVDYIFFVHFFIAFHFFIIFRFLGYTKLVDIKHGLKSSGWYILVVAILTLGYRSAEVIAVSLTYVGLAVAVKRASAFFATLLGGRIFHEQNLLRKSIACLVMLAGAFLVTI